MAKNNNRKSKLKQVAKPPDKSHHVDINNVEAKFLGLTKKDKSNPETAFVALKYFQPQHECLSDWDKEELSALSSFIGTLSQMPWTDIIKTGGKQGNKVGVGYTLHKNRDNLPKCAVLDKISEDISFFELRVTGKARVHGFRCKSTFFLVWLDRNHQIYPE